MDTKMKVRTDFTIGERAKITKTVSEEDIIMFAKVVEDYNLIHFDSNFAGRTRFKRRIVHGILGAGLISAVLGTKLPGSGSIYISQNLKFTYPVYIGDTLTAEVEVLDWNPSKGIIKLYTRCSNQAGKNVIIGEAVLMVEQLK